MISDSDDIMTKLAFLSVERKILMNWKQCGPNCVHMENWCKDFTDLLSKEQVALTLQEGDLVLGKLKQILILIIFYCLLGCNVL